VPVEPFAVWDVHPAEDALAAFDQLVNIVTNAYVNHAPDSIDALPAHQDNFPGAVRWLYFGRTTKHSSAMKKFLYGTLLGLILGVGIGWLAFSGAGRRTVDEQVDTIGRKVDDGMNEVGKKLKDVSK